VHLFLISFHAYSLHACDARDASQEIMLLTLTAARTRRG
jgi:hypothetical protein